MSLILDPESTCMIHTHMTDGRDYYVKHVTKDAQGHSHIVLAKERLVHKTTFFDGTTNRPVSRPYYAAMYTRSEEIVFATFPPCVQKQERCYVNVLGSLSMQHGQTYPTNGLGWPRKGDLSNFVGVLVVNCKGVTICRGENGDCKLIMDQPQAYSFEPTTLKCAGEKLQDYASKVWEDFKLLWQTQFQTQPQFGVEQKPAGHDWNTPAFLAKFKFNRSLVPSEAYITDLSLIQRLAHDSPELGIGAYLPPSKRQKVAEKVSEPPQLAAPAPLVRLVHPQLLPPTPVPTALAATVAAQEKQVEAEEKQVAAREKTVEEGEAPPSLLVPPAAPAPLPALQPELSEEDAITLMRLPLLPRRLAALSAEDLDFFQ